MKIKIAIIAVCAFILAINSSFVAPETDKFDYLVTISTDYGDMKLLLFDDTPIHKENFLKLIKEEKFNGSTFHRVIEQFMIQGGEIPIAKRPAGSDTLNFESQTLPHEIKENHKHYYGALSAARTENPEKRSDKSQFFIVQNRYGAHHLDNAYTVFGQLMAGFDVMDKIAKAESVNSKPVVNIVMKVTYVKVLRIELEKFYGKIYK